MLTGHKLTTPYRVGREVVVGWYDQEQFDRVVELIMALPELP
jgi:hypothetical protein